MNLLIIFLIVISIILSFFFHIRKRKKISSPPRQKTPSIPKEMQKEIPDLKDKYVDLLRKMIGSLSHNYKDIQVIEKGGMGLIAKAYDKERKRNVAIKTILPELKDDTGVGVLTTSPTNPSIELLPILCFDIPCRFAS